MKNKLQSETEKFWKYRKKILCGGAIIGGYSTIINIDAIVLQGSIMR